MFEIVNEFNIKEYDFHDFSSRFKYMSGDSAALARDSRESIYHYIMIGDDLYPRNQFFKNIQFHAGHHNVTTNENNVDRSIKLEDG